LILEKKGTEERREECGVGGGRLKRGREVFMER
jgi:hypothetical protein